MKYDDNQPCCPNPGILINRGRHPCLSQLWNDFRAIYYFGSERRAYTNEEVQARQRTEPKWRSFGPRTVITSMNGNTRGHQLEAKNQDIVFTFGQNSRFVNKFSGEKFLGSQT